MAIKDLTHTTFGRLYVESLAYTKNNRAYWNCSCACGNKCIKMGKYLLDGSTKSCGCLAKESSVIIGKNNQKHNNFTVQDDDTVIVHCVNGDFLCDKNDWEQMQQYYWYITPYGYVRGYINGKQQFFHDVILNIDTSSQLYCDHINRIKTDNRRNNLRIVTIIENMRNKGLYKNNKSNYSGVNYYNHKWYVYISGKYIGVFDNYDNAVQCRQQLEKEYGYNVN